MADRPRDESSHTRRAVLQIAAAAAASAGVAGVATAQDDDDGGDAEDDETDRLPIVLGGRTEYWYGIVPEENPTLESGDSEEFAVSDATETAGETVSMTVEASGEIDEYYCGFHPDSMRGDVELNDGFDLSSDDRDDDDRDDGSRDDCPEDDDHHGDGDHHEDGHRRDDEDD